MYRPKIVENLGENEWIYAGHPACHGCGAALGLRHLLKAMGKDSILVVPAGCTSIIAGTMNAATFNVPFIHTAFGSAAAVASGVVEALNRVGKEDVNVVVWAGDGGTYDIGLASLSGAAERGHNILFVLDDNEAYMNTGIQRSGGTPRGAWTTTTITGKKEEKKDIMNIVLSHHIPYAATASVAYPLDFHNKVKKALNIRGFKFIHLMAPCPPGWRFETHLTIEIAKKAILSGAWILMEYENGKLKLNPPSSTMLEKRRISLKEYLMSQGRFRHVKEELLKELERDIEERWREIRDLLNRQRI